MLALRSVARAAVRPAQRLSQQYTRQTIRSPSSLLQQSWRRSSLLRTSAAFSTSIKRSAPEQSTVKKELAEKIDSELKLEKEMRDPDSFPTHLKEFLESSEFELLDTPGKEEVVMTRKYGDENIKIVFSIDDLNNADQDADPMAQDAALMDEADDGALTEEEGAPSKPINQRGGNPRTMPVAPEDSIAPSDRAETAAVEEDEEDLEDEQDPTPPFTSHCFITIDKGGKGALQIEAMAQDGMILIDNVYYYENGKLVDPQTRDDEMAARDLYTGPPFGNLDEDLQILFERYLEERGINSTLALFVPEYIDYKEQREYTRWLSGVKKFFA